VSPFLRRALVITCLVFGIAHAVALPPTLEDLDSVNFALGVEAFDIRAHRPHPPGYPVYILMARASTAAVRVVAPGWPRDRQAAAGLAMWSVGAGACAALVLAAFWLAIGLPAGAAAVAALLCVVAPLFWLTAGRPLTDTPGLIVAVLIQTGLIRGLRHLHRDPADDVPRVWWWAALGAGLLIGLRTQTMWLTGPLLCWCAGELVGHRRWREAAQLVATAAVGVLLWLLPMLFLTGGVREYLIVLGGQGTDDFLGVQMLATDPSWALLRIALTRTFHIPWLQPALAWTVLGLAILGLVRLLHTRPRVLALVTLAYWPYLVFHLTFQEAETIRYALPLLIPVAGFAAVALQALGTRGMAAACAVFVVSSLWFGQPALRAYGAAGAPIFRTFADLEAAVPRPGPDEPPTALAMHHRVASEARQAIIWARTSWPFTVLSTDVRGEVQAVVEHFLADAKTPVWFLANPVRRDLEAIDPRARQHQLAYRWDAAVRPLIAFVRPSDVDAWVIMPPRWMLGRGWALTPEMGGVTGLLTLGPHRRAAVAYLRRDAAPLRVVVGGRHLGAPGSPGALITASLDGRVIAQWTTTTESRFFRQWIELPHGTAAGAGPYATLEVTAASAAPRIPAPSVGLEFFDAGTHDDVVWAHESGWHEPEQDASTGRGWRWMSRHAEVRVAGPDGDITVTLRGESPLRYFVEPSELVVRVGDVEVGRVRVAADFTEVFRVPAAVLAAAGGRVIVDTNQIMVPADDGVSLDRRELGLRIYDVVIAPVR